MLRYCTTAFVISLFFFSSCKKEVSLETDATAALEITITHKVDGAPLQLNTTYINQLNEDFNINKFKYYISNVQLLTDNGAVAVPETYFLVDEETASSKSLKTLIPTGTYTGISFLMGVDSLRNVSGAQTGALDPTLGMFWTWNTGYIMAKMEGFSSFSTLPNNKIEYHIGGFKQPYNILRPVTINFTNGEATLAENNILKVDLDADVQKWFSSVHSISIATNAGTMTPGNGAMQVADNYSTMFTLTSAGVQ